MKITFFLLLSLFSMNGFSQTKRSEAEALKIVTNLYERINTGENISTLKRLYSEDAGSIKEPMVISTKDDIDKEFKQQVYKLKLNEVSNPFKTKYGYSLVKVIEITGKQRKIEHILIIFNN